jgi:acetylornithine deacetylase/succinyl-diaminopimelate desuccinylase-like protein
MSEDDQPGGGLTKELDEAVQAGMPRTVSDLTDLVRIPSVSWSAFDPANVQLSADAVAGLLRDLHVFESVAIARAPIGEEGEHGQPAVIARREAKAGAPTVLLYAHHDVQPPGKDEDWQTAPFEPTVRGDRLYARGAADDKAGVMAHVAAIRALIETVGEDLDLGIAVFIEGEEEFGSRSFANFLARNKAVLAADAIVVADSDNWSVDIPSLTVGLRGNVTFRLTVSTLEHASHSGMYGGGVPDAMMPLAKLLASLHDDDGYVAVAGMTAHDAPVPDYAEQQLREEAAVLEGVSLIGRGPLLARLWNQPTITVTGIDAPSVANASNTLLPSVAVRISSRVAPGQRAEEAFEAIAEHLHVNTPYGARIEIDDVDLGDPFLVDTSGWAAVEAKAAMKDAWGAEPVEAGIGAASRSSPTWSGSSRTRRSWSRASKIPTRARTARTSRCTSASSAGRSSPRRCCLHG